MTIVNIPMDDGGESYEKEFVPVEPGVYEVEVVNALRVEKAASSGNNVIKVELKILTEGEEEGKTIFENLALTKKSYYRFYQFARACGHSKEEITEGIDIANLQGVTLQVRTKQQTSEYQGETRIKPVVARYLYEGSAADEENQQ